ncbi:uncharacterized protein EDB93DRAFT_453838 [Suillus bovinus]|uniref:uncharacterized protein n=1 Tax=Suillus bovinus TaxID=48563 RepID=UPI001B86651E|nr:uncharacterized protein EDB93DRAFT_453838 [Suillus bovinus]KAG2146875.1 hypothetical protein EDB93DRAFT_453838 [Suillus bovinus]
MLKQMSCCMFVLKYLDLWRTTIRLIKLSTVVQGKVRVPRVMCYYPLTKYTVCGCTSFVYLALMGQHAVVHGVKGKGSVLVSLFLTTVFQTNFRHLTRVLTLIYLFFCYALGPTATETLSIVMNSNAFNPNGTLPTQNVPGPSLDALRGMANEAAGIPARYQPPGLAQTWNPRLPPPPIPQGYMYPLPAYGHNLPIPNYYGGYFGTQAPLMQAPPAPAVQVPLQQEEQVLPNAAPIPQVPSVATVEGGSTRRSKRKAVDDGNTTAPKRFRPQDDPDFAPAQPDDKGNAKWKCLKEACASAPTMLEVSVHQHVKYAKTHRKDSERLESGCPCPTCGFVLSRPDALKRHQGSTKCIKNQAKTVGGSTFGATASVAMPQQQFDFGVQVPAWSSVTQKSSVRATRTEPSSTEAPALPAPFKPTSVQQQPAVAPPVQAFRGTMEQICSPIPASAPKAQPMQPLSGHTIPVIAGDLSLSMFNKTAAPALPSPLSLSEDAKDDDSLSGLFSEPSSPAPDGMI